MVDSNHRRRMAYDGTVMDDRRVRHGGGHNGLDDRHNGVGDNRMSDQRLGNHWVRNNRGGHQLRSRMDDMAVVGFSWGRYSWDLWAIDECWPPTIRHWLGTHDDEWLTATGWWAITGVCTIGVACTIGAATMTPPGAGAATAAARMHEITNCGTKKRTFGIQFGIFSTNSALIHVPNWVYSPAWTWWWLGWFSGFAVESEDDGVVDWSLILSSQPDSVYIYAVAIARCEPNREVERRRRRRRRCRCLRFGWRRVFFSRLSLEWFRTLVGVS